MKNPQQMKSLVANRARQHMVPADTALHMYIMERFLDRVSHSGYRECLVLKGGFLLYTYWGLSNRTTNDLDMTHKSVGIEEDEAKRIVSEICAVDVDDDFEMTVVKTRPIAEELDHPGVRVFIQAVYGVSERFYVDLVPSPTIVPEEVHRGIAPMFGDDTIDIMAYRLETVIAEKIHAALTRDVMNTRMRDYYDFFVLERNCDIDEDLLALAVSHIFDDRGTSALLHDWRNILAKIREDKGMNERWVEYQGKTDHTYALGITFPETCDSAARLLSMAIARHPEEP